MPRPVSTVELTDAERTELERRVQAPTTAIGGSFGSVRALIDDIECYLADRNLRPKPYKWKAKGEVILRKLQRARAALDAQQETAVR